MAMTWVLVAILAEASEGQSHQGNGTNQADQINESNRPKQALVVSLAGATMTCTVKEDQLVCVIPLDKETTRERQPKTKLGARPSQPTLVLPGPEALAQLKAAEANIALAKSLLARATTPVATAFAQQLLYWAREQHRTASALLHTVRGDLHVAPDPFDGDQPEQRDGRTTVLCGGRSVADECSAAAQAR